MDEKKQEEQVENSLINVVIKGAEKWGDSGERHAVRGFVKTDTVMAPVYSSENYPAGRGQTERWQGLVLKGRR